MSRIGKLPIQLPAGVELTVSSENEVTVKGPLLSQTELFISLVNQKPKNTNLNMDCIER